MNDVREYWEKATPMNFADERWGYEKKRAFRYNLQDYMHETFGFGNWRGKEVLEVGCGSGIDALEFARNSALVTAVDITENAVVLTKALAEEAALPVNVMQAEGELPFPDGTFDLIYSFGVLHHIPNVDDTLSEIRRVLKPNGNIIAMVYNKDSLLHAYSIMHSHKDEGLSEEELTSKYSERNENCPYTKVYTKTGAKSLFEQYFTDVEVSVRYNVIDLPSQRKVKVGIGDEHELGWHLIVTGRGREDEYNHKARPDSTR